MKGFLRVSSALLLMTLLITGTVFAEDRGEEREGRYLALGDSVAFGFINHAGFEYVNPDNFIGYPEYVGSLLRADVVNAACPGATTGSFLSSAAADDGCGLFRANAPLHVTNNATQLDFATAYLRAHPGTRLVTISLGANDLFLIQSACAKAPNPAQCFQAALPGALGMIELNMETILSELRATGFKGVIVVANYYSLDYSNPAQNQFAAALNAVLAGAAAAKGAAVADVFTSFKNVLPTSLTNGNFTCKAGLLNASSQNQFVCDVHPSQSGQRLIGKTVAKAFAAATNQDRD